jgi:hypothetical protein
MIFVKSTYHGKRVFYTYMDVSRLNARLFGIGSGKLSDPALADAIKLTAREINMDVAPYKVSNSIGR